MKASDERMVTRHRTYGNPHVHGLVDKPFPSGQADHRDVAHRNEEKCQIKKNFA
jgi:hypothetical protein